MTDYWKPKPKRHGFAWWALLVPAVVYGGGVIIYAHNAFVPGMAHQNGHAIGSALMVFGGESGTLAAAAEVFRKQAAKKTNWMDWGGLAVSLVATLGNLFVVYVSLTELPVAWVGFVRLYGPLVLLICSGVDFYAGLMEFGFYNASFDARYEKWELARHNDALRRERQEREGVMETTVEGGEDEKPEVKMPDFYGGTIELRAVETETISEDETPEAPQPAPVVTPKTITVREWRKLAAKMETNKPKTAEELNQWLTDNHYEPKPLTTARRWVRE